MLILTLSILACAAPQTPAPSEGARPLAGRAASYVVEPIPTPDGVVLEVGGADFLPDGRLAVCTRRGDVWFIKGVLESDLSKVEYHRFASGLHEPLGLAARDGAVYCVQRGELTRLVDSDHDDLCDRFETVCDQWGVTGNYHEYSYGPKFDREGNAWITLNLAWTHAGESLARWRGWAVKVKPDGTLVPVCPGLRSPSGIGFNAAGDAFYSDNQGDWNAACSLRRLRPGHFMGHPEGLRWVDRSDPTWPKPTAVPDGVTFEQAVKAVPSLQLPAVWFPYKKMGQAASDILLDDRGGKFGPFQNQLFVGDQTTSEVMRVVLEKVGGEYQGACLPFVNGFDSGVLRLAWAPDNSMIVGMTNRGWGSLGSKEQGLARVRWTKRSPFEALEVHARPTGFELVFTEPVDAASASNPESYDVRAFTYEYHSRYGCDELDAQVVKIRDVSVSQGGLRVELRLEEMKPFYVHELHFDGVRNRAGLSPAHPVAYYTLNRVPEAPAAEHK